MLLDDLKKVVSGALQIGSRVEQMDAAAPLRGAVPELDSIAVVNLITALEEHFGITVAGRPVSAERIVLERIRNTVSTLLSSR